jgi:hypothetical protein
VINNTLIQDPCRLVRQVNETMWLDKWIYGYRPLPACPAGESDSSRGSQSCVQSAVLLDRFRISFTCHTRWQGSNSNSRGGLAGNLLHLPHEGAGVDPQIGGTNPGFPYGVIRRTKSLPMSLRTTVVLKRFQRNRQGANTCRQP